MGGIQLRKIGGRRGNRLDDVRYGGEGMDGPHDKLVESGIICYESDSFPVTLRDKEGW